MAVLVTEIISKLLIDSGGTFLESLGTVAPKTIRVEEIEGLVSETQSSRPAHVPEHPAV